MAQGKVKSVKGSFGFIESEDVDEEVFYHMDDVGGPKLKEGQEVEFEVEQSEKGPRASNLTRLGDAAVDTESSDADTEIDDEYGGKWVSINEF